MAKKNKKRTWQVTKASGFGAKNFLPELRKAEAMMAREQWTEALEVLTDLNRTNPNQSQVLDALLSVYYELQSHHLYQRTCEQYLALEPNNASINYVMGGIYLKNGHFLLALNTFQHCLERWPDHGQAEAARDLITELESHCDELLEDLNLPRDQGFELAVLHEQAQAYLEEGEYEKSRAAEEALLEKHPEFAPARNNLSLVAFMQGDLEGAIALCHQTLETHPHNIHALANLVRYQCLSGEQDAARATAEQLQASQEDASESWTKRAEALSFLGDDARILQLYEQAQQTSDWDESIESPMFLHLVAVAMARSGQPHLARQKWQGILERSQFSLAADNLNDLNQPLGQRQGAWPFEFYYWIPRSVLEGLVEVITHQTKKEDIKAATEQYLRDYPYIIALLPQLLERGDPVGRSLAISLANILDRSDLLRDFALGQQGTDQMRHEAALDAAKADLLPDSESARLWLRGEWQEIQLIAYEFHEEPLWQHDPKLEKLLLKANRLMKSENLDDFQTAERLYKQAQEQEPDAPHILNNLAGTYLLQKREAEAIALWTEITERFPEYVMARSSLALAFLKDKNIEAAESILQPLIKRQRFHYDEFAAFSRAQIRVLLAKNEFAGAESWLQMWANVDPDHPEVRELQHQFKLSPGYTASKLGPSI